MKKWIVAKKFNKELKKQLPELSDISLQLLFNRQIISRKEIDNFLYPDYDKGIINPFLFKKMDKAVDKIFKYLENNEKICIYGDYDADGVTSTALLTKIFKKLGAKVQVYIPDRQTEGYGLNKQAIKGLAKNGVKLIITVDCGTSNKEEVDLAKKLGIEVIITDHHQPPKHLPNCLIINHKLENETYPDKNLAGVGVAYKLAQGLINKCRTKNEECPINNGFEKWLLDLVAIGTVADCVPLLGENRILVIYGLKVLNKTRRIGIKELVRSAGLDKTEKNNTFLGVSQWLNKTIHSNKNQIFGKELNSYSIGFQIAPRLNAAGRLDHANTAYELLTTESPMVAAAIADKLEETNKKRQNLIIEITKQADSQVNLKDKIIVVIDPSIKKSCSNQNNYWHIGVIGLVAGRLTEKYNRPAIVITKNQGKIISSCRSIPEFDIISALQSLDKYLLRYGGHKQAAGFTLKSEKQLDNFVKDIKNFTKEKLKNEKLLPNIKIEAEIKLSQVDKLLLNDIKRFEPYGECNNRPKFLTKNLKIINKIKVGKESNHLKLLLQEDGSAKIYEAIYFYDNNNWYNKFNIKDRIDLVYYLEENNWNGREDIQLKIIDIRKT